MADTFAERIRVRREELGWSQAKLAEKCGTYQQQIDRYEKGTEPDLEMFQKLAAALGVRAGYLAFGDDAGAVKPPIDRELMMKVIAAIERRANSKIAFKPTPDGRANMALAIYDLVKESAPGGDIDARIERAIDVSLGK